MQARHDIMQKALGATPPVGSVEDKKYDIFVEMNSTNYDFNFLSYVMRSSHFVNSFINPDTKILIFPLAWFFSHSLFVFGELANRYEDHFR